MRNALKLVPPPLMPQPENHIVLRQFMATTQAATEAMRDGHEVSAISVGADQLPHIRLAPSEKLKALAARGGATAITDICNRNTGQRATIYAFERYGVRMEFEVRA